MFFPVPNDDLNASGANIGTSAVLVGPVGSFSISLIWLPLGCYRYQRPCDPFFGSGLFYQSSTSGILCNAGQRSKGMEASKLTVRKGGWRAMVYNQLRKPD